MENQIPMTIVITD